MIYYLQDILWGLDKDEQTMWKSDIFDVLCSYSTVIHKNYIAQLLADNNNDCAFYCMDFEFSIENCPSTIIYQKKNTKPKLFIISYWFIQVAVFENSVMRPHF